MPAHRARKPSRSEADAVPRRIRSGESEALASFAQQLEGIKHRFADAERQNDRFERHRVAVAYRADISLSIDDWSALFNAVQARLRLAAGNANDGGGTPSALTATVLECVEALDQLHALLGQARSPSAPIPNAG